MNENEKNEVMLVEEEETNNEPEIIEEEHSGMSTGLAMLIGGGLALGAVALGKKLKKVALGKKLKKVWAKRKARADASEVVDGEVVNFDENDATSNVTSIHEDDK